MQCSAKIYYLPQNTTMNPKKIKFCESAFQAVSKMKVEQLLTLTLSNTTAFTANNVCIVQHSTVCTVHSDPAKHCSSEMSPAAR